MLIQYFLDKLNVFNEYGSRKGQVYEYNDFVWFILLCCVLIKFLGNFWSRELLIIQIFLILYQCFLSTKKNIISTVRDILRILKSINILKSRLWAFCSFISEHMTQCYM